MLFFLTWWWITSTPRHSFMPSFVSFLLKSSLLCSPAAGVDDQTDNWDTRASNSFSHWSPADQARQPQQAAESSLWLCGTVGTEFPGLVKLLLCALERAQRDLLNVPLSLSTECKNPRREYSSYEKPWQIHPKKPKKSKSDLAVSSISPPSPESKSCKFCAPPIHTWLDFYLCEDFHPHYAFPATHPNPQP